jgi:uncharacterized membrane protein YhhN
LPKSESALAQEPSRLNEPCLQRKLSKLVEGRTFAAWGTWVLVGGMALSALANFASPTARERFFLGRSALLLAFLCFAATRVHAHSPANFHTHVSLPGRP